MKVGKYNLLACSYVFQNYQVCHQLAWIKAQMSLRKLDWDFLWPKLCACSSVSSEHNLMKSFLKQHSYNSFSLTHFLYRGSPHYTYFGSWNHVMQNSHMWDCSKDSSNLKIFLSLRVRIALWLLSILCKCLQGIMGYLRLTLQYLWKKGCKNHRETL